MFEVRGGGGRGDHVRALMLKDQRSEEGLRFVRLGSWNLGWLFVTYLLLVLVIPP